MMKVALIVAVAIGLFASMSAQTHTMNSLGERYVRLVLALGQHDTDYVDAYYGPPEWKQEVDGREGVACRHCIARRTTGTRHRDRQRRLPVPRNWCGFDIGTCRVSSRPCARVRRWWQARR